MIKELENYFESFKFEAENFFVKKFLFGDELKKEYTNCIDILFDISKTVDAGRGIIAFNPKYGQGKSFFFDVINHLYKRIYGRNYFKKVTAKDLVEIYVSTKDGEDPQKRLIEEISVKRLFIDDIGDEGENKVFRHYANELNVIRFVLLKRYEFWVDKGWITYGTTNLTIEQIAKNYDGRVSDRLLEMCHWRLFKFIKEGSFRQITSTRRLTQNEINENWDKLTPKEIQKSNIEDDKKKYFNDLINEPDEYFEGKEISFWSFVKDYLIETGLMDVKQLKVSEIEKKHAKIVLRNDVRDDYKQRFKHAPADVRQKNIDDALKNIKENQVVNVAENQKAREIFMTLRQNKHKF